MVDSYRTRENETKCKVGSVNFSILGVSPLVTPYKNKEIFILVCECETYVKLKLILLVMFSTNFLSVHFIRSLLFRIFQNVLHDMLHIVLIG